MKPLLTQYIVQLAFYKYLTLQLLGHEAPSNTLYRTIHFIKIFNPPIHGA
jgi:hypothetical protein